MANVVVTISNDIVDASDGETSLREALALANSLLGADTITFDAALSGQTITLGGSELILSSDVTIDGDIDGDDAADVTISGGGASRVFNVDSGTATLDALTITGGNAGSGFDSYGGGLYVSSGATVDLIHSTLSGNTAIYGGGIFNSGTATLTNSTLSGNTADRAGGGVYNRGTATLTNSTLSGNTADYGGGIFSYGIATLTNSTLSGNAAGYFGGGVDNFYGTLDLTNSIVLGNSAPNDAEIRNYNNYGTLNTTTSLTGAGGETAAQVFADIGPGGGGELADNGGPVLTIALLDNALNPALDAGTDSAAPATDATGAGRVNVPGLGNNGVNISDLGAVEFQTSLIVTTATDVVDALDGETSLREALTLANSDADASTITFAAALSGQTITLGGGELILSSDVTIDGDIDGDDAADITISGGGVSRVFNATSGTATLDALTITGGNAGSGGGLYVSSGATVALIHSTLSGNTASIGGGILNDGTATLTNSTLSGNTAGDFGGGIFNYGTATLTNTTLSGNAAGSFGGGFENFGTMSVTNSTLSGNQSTTGGGISNYGTLDLSNSIVLGNSAPNGTEISDFRALTTTTSLTGAGGETAAQVFAEIGPGGGGVLADNGGPVQTIALLGDALNPALDAGDDGAAPATDATGAGRVDVPGLGNNGGNISDLGAVELPVEAPSLIVTTATDVVDAFDGETSLREALTLANSNTGADTITFDASLSGQTITLGGSQLILSSDVTIVGDIDGDDAADITISGGGVFRVFNATSGTATLDALTITGGNAGTDFGGGVSVSAGATVDLIHSTLSGNEADFRGGGIYNRGTVTLTNSTLSGNVADFGGGGIDNRGTVTLTNSTLSGNRADYGDGGGIYNAFSGTATLTNSTLSGNTADRDGGGIYNSGTITLTNSTLSGNTAPIGGGIYNAYGGTVTLTSSTLSGNNSSIYGGGIYNRGTATLTNSTLSGNTAGRDGGGIYNRGTATLTNTTLSGNRADYGDGGGIDNRGMVTLTNSTLSGNTANDDGGGIDNSGTATLTNSTLSGNTAGRDGGGIYNRSTVTLTNSIVLGNSATSDAEIRNNNFGTLNTTTSLTGAGGETAAQVFADIGSGGGGVLADNGGPVQTIALLGDALNPALDAGTDNAAPATDATGAGRVDQPNATNNGPNISDLGAVELQGLLEAPSLIVTLATDVVDAFDGETSLREALALANAGAGADTITFNASLSGQTITLGGGELILSSDVTIDGDIDGDDAADVTISGGGVFRVFNATSGTATLDALTITGGNAGSGSGGGLSVSSGATVDLIHSTLSGNTAGDFGGGIYNAYGGTATLTNSTLGGNTADYGGGIYNSGTVTLTNSTLSGNTASVGGGIDNAFSGTATLTNSTLSGNEADFGGGVFNFGTATLTNSTLSGNTADRNGGGISNYGIATLTNSTLSGNAADDGGGGVYNFYGTLDLTNSIVLGNSAAGDAEISDIGGTVITTTSLTGAGGETAADVFAETGPGGGGVLGDNGGPVQTIALLGDALNPALDAGDDGAAPATDATGAGRVDVPGLGNNGANISDLGAVELQPSLIVTTVADVVDAFDGETSLREALVIANSNTDASTITFDAALSGQTITLGGSELILSSDVTIDGDIDGDDAADVTISGGGASRVFNVDSGTATLDALTITGGNAGTGSGGGLYVYTGAAIALTNSTLSGNTADDGGGILNFGTATLTNSTLSGNTASIGGGIYNADGGTVALTNTTLGGNTATSFGGGVYNRGTATLTNTTLSGNAAGSFGGGFENFGTMSVTNSTLSGNTADYGGGISNYGTLDLTNSIVLGNSAPNGTEIRDFGTLTTTTSLTGAGGETAAQVFAEIGPGGGGVLADNGGPVQTIALLGDALNPALDAGTDGAAPATDARGAGRADDPGRANTGGNISDLGAFELQLSSQTGGTGADLIFGNDEDNDLSGSDGPDEIYGLGGNDLLRGGGDADHLDGGDGIDTVVYDDSSAAVTVDLTADGDGVQAASGGDAEGDVLRGFESVIGSALSDDLTGDAADNALTAGAGNDRVEGGDGDDTLRGDSGKDTIYGGADDDLIIGGTGADDLFGEAGNDEIRGGGAKDLLNGGAGEDLLIGGGGNDGLRGGNDNDELKGNDGNDNLRGGNGDDRLDGGADNDTLLGGGGDDNLFGAAGVDILDGEAGEDTFVFKDISESTLADPDTIRGMDGVGVAGGDVIDLRAVDASSALGGSQDFIWLGEQALSGGLSFVESALWVENDGTDTMLYGTVDTDALIDFAVRIEDGAATTAADYILSDFLI